VGHGGRRPRTADCKLEMASALASRGARAAAGKEVPCSSEGHPEQQAEQRGRVRGGFPSNIEQGPVSIASMAAAGAVVGRTGGLAGPLRLLGLSLLASRVSENRKILPTDYSREGARGGGGGVKKRWYN
jgi:hypothetical protein